jgi:dTDP-4-amino-4,6-dideoxygalactose transaminase
VTGGTDDASLQSDPPVLDSIGYGRQHLDEADIAAVVDVLRGDLLTQGPRCAEFEAGLRAVTGAPHAIAVANGTGALHLAQLACDVGRGDLVLTSANTFLASATSAVHCGAEVGFLDLDPRSANLDLDELAARLADGPPVAAVVAVHFAGLPLDMQRLLDLKRAHGFRLIEDAAHALGATYTADGRAWRVGEHPEVDVTCLSFHPVKHITTGEGGALLSHDADRADRIRRLAAHGVAREGDLRPFDDSDERPAWYGPMTELGLNYRLSELHAALGVSQLRKLDRFLDRRRAIAAQYLEALRGCELPDPGDDARQHVWHLFVVKLESDRRDAVMARLAAEGVRTQLHYYPVPLQPWFRERTEGGGWPHAVDHARRALSLPLYPGLTDADVERVVSAFHRALDG